MAYWNHRKHVYVDKMEVTMQDNCVKNGAN